MKRRWNKNGQFYLIAAIILVMIIVGIAAITNYLKKDSNIEIYDIKEEIQIESSNVLDYATYNDIDGAELRTLLQTFTEKYVDYFGSGKDLYFIFGDKDSITVEGYQGTAKTVSAESGSSQTITETAGEFTGNFDPEEDILTLYIGEDSHGFELTEGENFYFVVSEEIDGGEYIISG